ncbi:hypothetical protein PSV08DRAFT_251946 [Bipolaris maydis]|uniref:uncharacterized protein n=1 Tax=Cochliobolus heterostrophus TaxID=5016 RepID=UPI0024D61C35|nr:hypothetical protein J3E73DRAFT_258677 [Bipolaris maydis]KAJ5057009.1 hypothetical protein J3E74DRAFT_293444 [Bipolaris maydis]KAJ6266206.1 hypothetical protein PSV08DRAFT_251946 [Bipolaris maydis]
MQYYRHPCTCVANPSLSNLHFRHDVTHSSSHVQNLRFILSPLLCFESHISQRCSDTQQDHASAPPPTPAPEKRQAAGQVYTYGYVEGNSYKPRVANSGYDCQFDTARGLSGFCPTTVTASSDCRLSFSSLASLSTSLVSLSNSPTPSPSASSSSNFLNIGAIVGGVVAAVVVICATIIGVLLIRRKGGKGGKAASNNDSGYSMQGLVDGKKSGEQVESRHEAVEMRSQLS